MNNTVYHASRTSGLTELQPNESTHKQKWVYATKHLTTSAIFLGDNFDFICQTGTENGKPYVYEQFDGALEHAYAGQKGSIYKLDGKNFKNDLTTEVVSETPERVLDEIKVEDSLDFLLDLEKKGKLKVYRYPDRPQSAPKDKSDIIEKAAQWTIDFGKNTLEQVKKYHPDILPKVLEKIEEIKRLEKSP